MSEIKECSHIKFTISLIIKYGSKYTRSLPNREFYNILSPEDKEKFKENFIQHRTLCLNESDAEISFFKKFIERNEND